MPPLIMMTLKSRQVVNSVTSARTQAILKPPPRKNFAISIARYNNQADADDPNRNPQIVSVTINLQDQTEILTVTPDDDSTPRFSVNEDGERGFRGK